MKKIYRVNPETKQLEEVKSSQLVIVDIDKFPTCNLFSELENLIKKDIEEVLQFNIGFKTKIESESKQNEI